MVSHGKRRTQRRSTGAEDQLRRDLPSGKPKGLSSPLSQTCWRFWPVFCQASSFPSTITFFPLVTAAGVRVTPFVILHKYRRAFLPPAMERALGFRSYSAPNGFMTKNNFFQIVQDVLIPFVVRQRDLLGEKFANAPAALIADGHISRFSASVFLLLHAFNIRLIILPSHTSAVTQPLDVSCFSLFKRRFQEAYRSSLQKAREAKAKEHQFAVLHGLSDQSKSEQGVELTRTEKRVEFCDTLSQCWISAAKSRIIRSGFFSCGLIDLLSEHLTSNRMYISMATLPDLGRKTRPHPAWVNSPSVIAEILELMGSGKSASEILDAFADGEEESVLIYPPDGSSKLLEILSKEHDMRVQEMEDAAGLDGELGGGPDDGDKACEGEKEAEVSTGDDNPDLDQENLQKLAQQVHEQESALQSSADGRDTSGRGRGREEEKEDEREKDMETSSSESPERQTRSVRGRALGRSKVAENTRHPRSTSREGPPVRKRRRSEDVCSRGRRGRRGSWALVRVLPLRGTESFSYWKWHKFAHFPCLEEGSQGPFSAQGHGRGEYFDGHKDIV